MNGWRDMFKRQDWNGIYEVMLELVVGERKDLLAELKRVVPETTEENGIEKHRRYKRPDEVSADLKGAAEILFLGELEASVECEPSKDGETWAKLRTEVETDLQGMKAAEEVTKGVQAISRKQHAQDALDYLETMELHFRLMRVQIDNERERQWFDEAMANTASNAFWAGRHFEAASKKSMESNAVRGEKVAGGSRNSAHATNAKYTLAREKTLLRMQELIASGLDVSSAASQCVVEGLGTSRGANRKLFYRHRKV